MCAAVRAHPALAEHSQDVRVLQRATLDVDFVVVRFHSDEPEAELIGEEVALSAPVALDVGVSSERLQTTAGAG